jgi:hypothetical protein
MGHDLIINGDQFSDYEGFVDAFNGAYLPGVGEPAWKGEISDLHEILEAAWDATGEPLTIRWIHSRKSMSDLGHEEMAGFWLRHLKSIPEEVFSPASYQLIRGRNQEMLYQARAGKGRTLFDYLVWQIRGEDELVVLKLE